MRSKPNDVDAIRRQMAQIRHRHHEDVRQALAGAETVAGWGRYIRLYPWAVLGAAAAAAYWIVSSCRGRVSAGEITPSELVGGHEENAESQAGDSEQTKTRQGPVGEAWSFVLAVAVRAAQNYAVHRLEQWIAQQRMMSETNHGPSPLAGGSEGSNGPRERTEGVPRGSERLRSNLVSGGCDDD